VAPVAGRCVTYARCKPFLQQHHWPNHASLPSHAAPDVMALSLHLDSDWSSSSCDVAGPVSAAARTSGGGTSWLFPFVDGAPPIGWHDASLYLILPVLLVAAQYASSAILSPVDPNDENANTQRVIIYLLPLTIGWFSLNVPSGLSLYYFSNSIFTSAQQVGPCAIYQTIRRAACPAFQKQRARAIDTSLPALNMCMRLQSAYQLSAAPIQFLNMRKQS
jgi:hypothetical protein